MPQTSLPTAPTLRSTAISAWFPRELGSWLRERYGLAYALFSLFLLTAVVAHGPARAHLASLALLWCMGLALRLLDDLTSLGSDRVRHPTRVLCRRDSVAGFWAGYAVVAMGVAAALSATLLVAWLGLNAALAAAHRLRSPHRVWFVLLKYPAIIAISAGRVSPPILAAVWAAMIANEILHDEAWLGRPARPAEQALRYLIFIAEGAIFWKTTTI